jgi:hypothetical protein
MGLFDMRLCPAASLVTNYLARGNSPSRASRVRNVHRAAVSEAALRGAAVLVKSYTFITLVTHGESLCGMHDNHASSTPFSRPPFQRCGSRTPRTRARARPPRNTFLEDWIPLDSLTTQTRYPSPPPPPPSAGDDRGTYGSVRKISYFNLLKGASPPNSPAQFPALR